MDSSGTAQLPVTAPDTITTWELSAFGVNGQAGVGVAAERAKLTVFKDFYVELALPYQVPMHPLRCTGPCLDSREAVDGGAVSGHWHLCWVIDVCSTCLGCCKLVLVQIVRGEAAVVHVGVFSELDVAVDVTLELSVSSANARVGALIVLDYACVDPNAGASQWVALIASEHWSC